MESFTHCFKKNFWQEAFGELKKVRSIAICALFVALRVAVKAFSIPIVPPFLYFSFDFIVNSIGAMIYGPILALLGGAVSDTVGAFLFPKGTYFFPYIFVEMTSGFIFALFLYRSKLGGFRIILSRFSVSTICNLVMNPVINYFYYMLILGKKYTVAMVIASVAKNVAMLPLECLILIFLLGAAAIPLAKTGVIPPQKRFKPTAGNIVLLIVLTLVSATAIVGYMWYKGLIFA